MLKKKNKRSIKNEPMKNYTEMKSAAAEWKVADELMRKKNPDDTQTNSCDFSFVIIVVLVLVVFKYAHGENIYTEMQNNHKCIHLDGHVWNDRRQISVSERNMLYQLDQCVVFFFFASPLTTEYMYNVHAVVFLRLFIALYLNCWLHCWRCWVKV